MVEYNCAECHYFYEGIFAFSSKPLDFPCFISRLSLSVAQVPWCGITPQMKVRTPTQAHPWTCCRWPRPASPCRVGTRHSTSRYTSVSVVWWMFSFPEAPWHNQPHWAWHLRHLSVSPSSAPNSLGDLQVSSASLELQGVVKLLLASQLLHGGSCWVFSTRAIILVVFYTWPWLPCSSYDI
jgi:hypothetical protein